MGQVLHTNAVTTHVNRKEIQEAPDTISTTSLAKRFGINYRTVQKWRQRDSVEDLRSGPKEPRPKSLSKFEEAACLIFRCATKLPLDDCLYTLQESISHLKRSNLHRLFQNYGISTFPKEENQTPETKTLKEFPIGYFHVDIVQVNTEEGLLYMFVAIDRTSKFAYVELHVKSTRAVAAQFLKTLIEKVPYTIHTVLTDNRSQFTNPRIPNVIKRIGRAKNQNANRRPVKYHEFDAICIKNNVEHHLTPPGHPWKNEQVERMNRTINETTLEKIHYKTHDKLREHLQHFVDSYNYGRKFRALKGLTVFEYIKKCWEIDPSQFKSEPKSMLARPKN